MIITYLKSLDENKTGNKLWKYSDPVGLTNERIEEIESLINNGKPFPKAFKEFLYLAGDVTAIGLGPAYDVDDGNGIEYIQSLEVYKKLMANEGLSIERPFVVINSGADSSFDFIYLDEGDNPRPRFFYIDDNLKGDDSRIGDFPEDTFSELIDRLVDHALKGLQPF